MTFLAALQNLPDGMCSVAGTPAFFHCAKITFSILQINGAISIFVYGHANFLFCFFGLFPNIAPGAEHNIPMLPTSFYAPYAIAVLKNAICVWPFYAYFFCFIYCSLFPQQRVISLVPPSHPLYCFCAAPCATHWHQIHNSKCNLCLGHFL